MTARHFAMIGTLASSMLAASAAFAEDGKAYPGSSCQAQFDHLNATIARSGASLLNVHTTAVKLFCPIVKDIEAGRIKRAEVMVDDNHTGQDVVCELFSLGRDGAVVQSSRRNTTGTSGGRPVALTFGIHSANARGYYALTCELPASSGLGALGPSRIVGYNVVEE